MGVPDRASQGSGELFAEYQNDEYFELELPVAPAVMVADEIVVEGASVSQDKVEKVICRCLGIPEPQKNGILNRLFK